jgi:hypothetical protein
MQAGRQAGRQAQVTVGREKAVSPRCFTPLPLMVAFVAVCLLLLPSFLRTYSLSSFDLVPSCASWAFLDTIVLVSFVVHTHTHTHIHTYINTISQHVITATIRQAQEEGYV